MNETFEEYYCETWTADGCLDGLNTSVERDIWDHQQEKIETLKKAIIELKKSNDFYGEQAVIMEDDPWVNDYSEVCHDNLCVEVCGKLAREVNQNQAVQEAYKMCGVEGE